MAGVVRDGKGAVSEGPYAETKDIVGGYRLIEARDLAEAVRLTARRAAPSSAPAT